MARKKQWEKLGSGREEKIRRMGGSGSLLIDGRWWILFNEIEKWVYHGFLLFNTVVTSHMWVSKFELITMNYISSAGKESAYNAGDPSLIPGSGRSPGEVIGYPLQYS